MELLEYIQNKMLPTVENLARSNLVLRDEIPLMPSKTTLFIHIINMQIRLARAIVELQKNQFILTNKHSNQTASPYDLNAQKEKK